MNIFKKCNKHLTSFKTLRNKKITFKYMLFEADELKVNALK